MVVAVSPTPSPLVLVVDAQPLVREWARHTLDDEGFEVVEAAGRPGALAAIARRAPAVVVVDPAVIHDGGSLVTSLCRAAPGAAVVVLTASADGAAVLEAVRSGARGYITKSSTGADLAAAVRTVIDGGLALDQTSLGGLTGLGRAGARPAESPLSRQELRVLRLVAEGMTNREIGTRLFLSPHTVKNYLRNAADKLGAATRLDAVLEASRRGLIELPAETGRARAVREGARRVLYPLTNACLVLNELLPTALLSA